MKKLITICAVAGLIMAVTGTAQADLDIDGIYIDSCKDHQDNIPNLFPWEFGIWVDFVDTGDLDHIDVTKPGISTPFITIYEDEDGEWDWEDEWPDDPGYLTLEDLRDNYPLGEYTFDFLDSGDTPLRSVTLDYNGIDEPLNFVDFTYPEYDGQLDISTTPTLSWNIDAAAGDALDIWVTDRVASEDVDTGDFPFPMTTTSCAPGSLLPDSLLPDREYKIGVSVLKVKDLIDGKLPTMTTVDNDTFTYGLLMEYENEIRFTTVPEPATIALLGLGGLLLRKRRDRKQSKK